MGIKAANRISNTILYVILILMSIIWLIPFVCIVVQSFRVYPTGMSRYLFSHPDISFRWGFDNYVNLWKSNFPKWYLNTFVIALFVAVVQTVIVLCMSYTLSRFRFKLRAPMMKFMLILGMFPGMLTMIILYQVLKDLGLALENAVPGLMLVYVASSGMGYYVSKGFFDTIPKSLDEAARVDGATRAQVLFKIILPLAKPIVIYTILTAFMAPWGDFVFAKYIVGVNPSAYNVAVGLQDWLSTSANVSENYTKFCAGGVVVAIPVTILFICLQRYYVEGVTGGAVKG
ncbi:MAG: ABC transporter permease subunit [Oscillospiraceae bacterium]|nr:ABC transporter permease subunit [Oscillospiraceae bacterium]